MFFMLGDIISTFTVAIQRKIDFYQFKQNIYIIKMNINEYIYRMVKKRIDN